VRNLMAVAAFRHTCRQAGVAEVAAHGPASIRLGPVELPDSAQLRLKRLYPRSVYKPASKQVIVPRPTEGDGRIGAPPLRDIALLDWCIKLLADLGPVPVAAGAGQAGAAR
jgi:transcription-repair coupling factor (superfamily II helicase)